MGILSTIHNIREKKQEQQTEHLYDKEIAREERRRQQQEYKAIYDAERIKATKNIIKGQARRAARSQAKRDVGMSHKPRFTAGLENMADAALGVRRRSHGTRTNTRGSRKTTRGSRHHKKKHPMGDPWDLGDLNDIFKTM